MIIEFNGLPGTGKTTTARELAAQLEHKGYTCHMSYNQEMGKVKRRINYLFNGTYHLLYMTFKFIKNDVVSNEQNKYATVGILLKFYNEYLAFQKKYPNDILIIDQGVIQGVLSLVYTGKITRTKELEKIMLFFKKKKICFYSVDCLCDSKLCLQRMKNRGRAYGRVDSKPEEEIIPILKGQESALLSIRKVFNSVYHNVAISTAYSVESNTSKIVSFIASEKENEK